LIVSLEVRRHSPKIAFSSPATYWKASSSLDEKVMLFAPIEQCVTSPSFVPWLGTSVPAVFTPEKAGGEYGESKRTNAGTDD
jgi:hypothetical protein